MKKALIIYLLFSICSVYLHPVFSQEKLETRLEKVMEEFDAVGLAVVVVKDNEIVYEGNFGYKDLENKITLEKGDVFRIASISKSFTATGIMQLVEKGVIRLDDDVSKLIGFEVRNPNYPDIPITLRMILSHTSSLNDSQKYSSLDIINPRKNKTWSRSYSSYMPGGEYKYCNLNYNLAGAILEKWSGTRFDFYIKEHILSPLGLTGGYDVDSLDRSKFVNLYRYDNVIKEYKYSSAAYRSVDDKKRNYKLGYSAPIFSPTGGMKISAEDLAKYMVMHMSYGEYNGKRIISDESSKIMQSPISKASDKAFYGLGIRLPEDFVEGVALVGHTGSAYGLFSAMFFDPQKKIGFVIITNGSKRIKTGNYNSLLSPTAELLYQEFVD